MLPGCTVRINVFYLSTSWMTGSFQTDYFKLYWNNVFKLHTYVKLCLDQYKNEWDKSSEKGGYGSYKGTKDTPRGLMSDWLPRTGIGEYVVPKSLVGLLKDHVWHHVPSRWKWSLWRAYFKILLCEKIDDLDRLCKTGCRKRQRWPGNSTSSGEKPVPLQALCLLCRRLCRFIAQQ